MFAEVPLDEFEHAGEGGVALEDVLLAADVAGLAEELGVVDAGDEEHREVLVGVVAAGTAWSMVMPSTPGISMSRRTRSIFFSERRWSPSRPSLASTIS